MSRPLKSAQRGSGDKQVPTPTDPRKTIDNRVTDAYDFDADDNFDPEVGDCDAMEAMRPSKESDQFSGYWPPYGVDKVGRVNANAGQEGAQAAYEYRAHHTGRGEEADYGPDYGPAYQIRRPHTDET